MNRHSVLKTLRVVVCLAGLCLAGFAAAPAGAQVPVTGNPDHESMLAAKDPALAANKRLVYDFWREVFEAAQMDKAEKYMAADYIQHNPMVPTGRQAFIDFFSKVRKPSPVEAKVKAPLVAVMADGDGEQDGTELHGIPLAGNERP